MTDALTLRFTANGTRDTSDTQVPQFVGLAVANPTPAEAAYPKAPRDARATSFNPNGLFGFPLSKDNYEWQTMLRADYAVNDDIMITSITSYARNRQRYDQNLSGTELNLLDFTVAGNIHTFSQELRVTGTTDFSDSKLNWIVGGNIERDSTAERVAADINDSATAHVFTGPPFNLGLIDYVPIRQETHFGSEAMFANADYSFGQFTVHGGLRVSHTATQDAACDVQAGNLVSPTGIFEAFGVPLSYIHACAPETCRRHPGADLEAPAGSSWCAALSYPCL